MKKLKFNKVYWRNIISFLIFGVFIHFAMSTITGTNQQKRDLGDGRVEIARIYSDGTEEIIQGRSDGYESWQGPTTIEYKDDMGMRTAFEEVNMVDGKRHGKSIVTYPGGGQTVFCYNMGERVECEKSALAGHNSSYEILSYKYPWFTLKLNVFGFSDDYIKAYMDTLETVFNELKAEIDNFEDLYDETDDILSETHYERFISFNGELTLYLGVELSKNSEFRRAVLDQQRSKDNSLNDVIKNNYPNYLNMLNEYGVSGADFEAFGHVFDSLMNTYTPLDVNDVFFIDSVDTRMYNAIMWIYDSGDNDLIALDLQKSLSLINAREALQMLSKKSNLVLAQDRNDIAPDQVSAIVLSLLLMNFTDADLIRNSVFEWYSLEQGMAILPTATTSFVNRNSASSVTVSGNISADGGADISARGIVWSTGFNPLLSDNVISLGTGTGSFETQITGLNETNTYYARSYATNSAGTAYGNCLMFTTNLAVGIQSSELSDTKISIYPNPASEKVNVSFSLSGAKYIEITIINMNGQTVKNIKMENPVEGENQVNFDVSELETGIYQVLIKNEDNSIDANKLIITR